MQLKNATKKQIMRRMTESIGLASMRAKAGRKMRSGLGDPMAMDLALCAIKYGGRAGLLAARHAVAEFEAAWRIVTPESRDVIITAARQRAAYRATMKAQKAALAAGTDEDRRIAAHYATLSGKARKNYRKRHGARLNALKIINFYA